MTHALLRIQCLLAAGSTDMNAIIKTIHKDRLPKGWSYPVGAEAISSLLLEARQFNEIELFFQDRGQYWKSDFNITIKEQGEIKILDFGNSYLSDGGYLLHVYAVPSEKRQHVNEQFIAGILPALRAYLKSSSHRKDDLLFFRAFLNLKDGTVRINRG
jgi:hypothetical protein